MKKATKIFVSLAIFLMLFAPVFSIVRAADTDTPDEDFVAGRSLVPCGHMNAQGVINNPCSFKDVLTLVNAVVKFILFKLVVPIAAIMFFYAGFQLVTSGGSTEKRGMAKKVFTNSVIGLALAVGAWLIVNTILSILGYDGAWIGF